MFLSSLLLPALLANISIRGRSRGGWGGERRETFFKDTPLTPDSCSRLSLLFSQAKIFALENVALLHEEKEKKEKKKSVEKLPEMCVPEFAFPLKSLHDKLKFFSFFFFFF